jgi:hypothetical protein
MAAVYGKTEVGYSRGTVWKSETRLRDLNCIEVKVAPSSDANHAGGSFYCTEKVPMYVNDCPTPF